MSQGTQRHEVLRLAHAGDTSAMDALLRLCRSDVRRYAQRHCLIGDVEDAVQESLLVLSRKLRSVRMLAAFSGWLFQVVRRECRRLSRQAFAYDPWDEAAADHWAAHQSDDALRLDLASALASLPTTHREIILLRDVQECTIAEIADQLQLSVAAAKSRLHRARAMTREYLLAGYATAS